MRRTDEKTGRCGRAILFGIALGLATTGCATIRDATNPGAGTEFPLQVSADIPAAKASVRVRESNGQQKVRLEADHLAMPERAAEGTQHYVVWLQPAGKETPYNVGVLRVKEDRSAKFETTTPFRAFRIFVTAESSPSVTEPSRRQMMATSVQPGRTF